MFFCIIEMTLKVDWSCLNQHWAVCDLQSGRPRQFPFNILAVEFLGMVYVEVDLFCESDKL